MGAKQSKRSVDISGKEAESAGEVAASIASGEGRVEQLADADALKPQLNGDAHIHETEEKQKDVDSGTPENEKDATTEKETKQTEEEKEAAPLTNGESEQKVENGESSPVPEDGEKPKKEKKVKKKWSLRSISFSRKDKPKQEKKAKDEEPKTNGEPEKVPEETAEVAPEVPAVTETAEEAKTPSEVKEDKTPETPVTEPITNGSSTPESPKVETPVAEEQAAPCPEIERPPEPKAEIEQPEQLPINGLSLEEPTKETTDTEKIQISKEEPAADTTEIVPEISVIKEVCVEQMPLIDSTPPPLPANPPPSSVASFAATTMAPELTDASLANTADNATPPTPSDSIAKDQLDNIPSVSENNLPVAQTVCNTLSSSPVKEVSEDASCPKNENGVEPETEIVNVVSIENNLLVALDKVIPESETVVESLIEQEQVSDNAEPEMPSPPSELVEEQISEETKISQDIVTEMPPPSSDISEEPKVEKVSPIFEQEIPAPPELIEVPTIEKEIKQETPIIPEPEQPVIVTVEESINEQNAGTEMVANMLEPEMPAPPEEDSVVSEIDSQSNVENLPSPPPPICDEVVDVIPDDNSAPENHDIISEIKESVGDSNHISDTKENGPQEEPENDNENKQNLKNKSKDSLGKLIETTECNGNTEEEKKIIDNETATVGSAVLEQDSAEIVPPADCMEVADVDSARTKTPPRAGPATPQELLPVSDKLADLISEVPEVPQLITETLQETTSDVEVAN